MSFNKNNPNAMGKIMGYLKQLSVERVSYQYVIAFVRKTQSVQIGDERKYA